MLQVKFYKENMLTFSKKNADDVTVHDIMVLLSVYSGVSTLLLILVILYFPSNPPTPPSISAAEERTDWRKGWKGG